MFVGEEVASKLDRGTAASNLVTLDCTLSVLMIITDDDHLADDYH